MPPDPRREGSFSLWILRLRAPPQLGPRAAAGPDALLDSPGTGSKASPAGGTDSTRAARQADVKCSCFMRSSAPAHWLSALPGHTLPVSLVRLGCGSDECPGLFGELLGPGESSGPPGGRRVLSGFQVACPPMAEDLSVSCCHVGLAWAPGRPPGRVDFRPVPWCPGCFPLLPLPEVLPIVPGTGRAPSEGPGPP